MTGRAIPGLAAGLLVVALGGCAGSVPGRTEVAKEGFTINDPRDLIVCPEGSSKRSKAVYYRDLSLPSETPMTSEVPAGYQPPRLLRAPQVAYPRGFTGKMKPGFVSVAFAVNADGSTGNPRVVCSSDGRFEGSAMSAAVTMRYQPAYLDGAAIVQTAIQPFKFSLD